MNESSASQKIELLLLKIRNLIASKEFEVAEANLETTRYGEWQCDHQGRITEIDVQIEKLTFEVETHMLSFP